MTVNTTNSAVGVQYDVDDLTVRQELKTLQFIKGNLDEARKSLGRKTRFWELAFLLDEAINKADREIIGADEFLKERS